ncbi:MAG: VOC family protein [Chloroflexi bacterium]|nr:VOC family protein [Chloroflexota bacterium]
MTDFPFPSQADQVGVVVRDMGKAIKYYSETLGIGPFVVRDFHLPEGLMKGKKVSVDMKLAFASLGAVQFELIEAPPGDNIYREFLEANGEGLHHIGFSVDNLDDRVAELRKRGVGVLFSGKTERASFAYLEPGETGGVIFELIQRK